MTETSSAGWTAKYVQAYDYDRFGNRTINAAQTWGVAEPQFTVDAASNCLGVPNGQTGVMSYDTAGNLTNDTYTGRGVRTYDAENRMTSAQDSWDLTSHYTYDGDGKRVKRKTRNEEVWQVYGIEGELLAEYAAGNAPYVATKEYGYRGGELLVTITSGDTQRLRRFITNLYDGALGRDPSAGELQLGTDSLAQAGVQGPSQLLAAAQSLAASLFQSSEYANRPGRATDTGLYVTDLYYAYLQRAPDDTGLTYWTNLTGSLGRAGVRNEFAWSGEFQTLAATLYGTSTGDDQRTDGYIRKFYLGAYGREPNSTEASQQRSRLNTAATQGQSQVQAEAELMGRELFAAQVTNGSISNAQYVTNLYEAFLQRGPDAGGLNWWVGQAGGEITPQNPLNATKRQNVLNGFATASAAQELAGTLYREVNWVVGDHLGTPRMVVDKTGSLAGVKRHDYLPFGEEIGAGVGGRTTNQGYSQPDGVRQKWAKLERDDETGLDYAQNRYYSSMQGRFTSADPIPMTSMRPADPQQLNLYAYVRNNPLRHTDPTGLDLYATGSEADRYRKDLEKATGLKLKLDAKTGQITIVKEPKKLGADAQKIKGIITDSKNTVRIDAIRDPAGSKQVLVGQFEGNGKQTLDYADIDKFGKQKGGTTPGSVAIHETTEAYEGITNPKALADPNGPFPAAHDAAIGYENAHRARVGLGARVESNQSVTQSGNDVTITIDYTTHRERVTVDRTNPNQIKSVVVEKKKP